MKTGYQAWVDFTSRQASKIMAGICLAYFAYVGALSVLDHWGLRTQLSDLGHMEQAIWQVTQGRFSMPLSDPLLDTSRYAQHANVIFYLIAPFYSLVPRPEFLLLLGTAAVATAGWLLFLLARRVLKNNLLALLFGASLLLNPLVQEANLYDFHVVTLAMPLLIAAIYSFEQKWWPLYWLSTLLLLTVKEDMIILVCFIGLYAILRRQARLGLFTIIAALSYAIVLLVAVPAFADVEASYLARRRFRNLDANPLTYLKELADPHALTYLLYLAPQGVFLSVFAPAALLLALPNVAQNVLAAGEWQTRITEVYYSGIVIAALYTAAVLGYRRLRRQDRVLSPILLALFAAQALGLSLIASPTPYGSTRTWTDFGAYYDKAAMQRILSQIPPGASVATQNNVAAHLARRERIVKYSFYKKATDYIVLHVQDPTSPGDTSDLFYFEAPARRYRGHTARYREKMIEAAFREPDFGVVDYAGGWYLLRRGHSRERNEAAYRQALADLPRLTRTVP
jgi:uncharacterized membrane protein